MNIVDVIKILVPFFLGILSGVVIAYSKFELQAHYAEKDRQKKHKLNVAKHVHEICNEADTGHYLQFARDVEHVNATISNVKGIDKVMGEKMNDFVDLWNKIVVFHVEYEIEGLKSYMEKKDKMVKEAKKKNEFLMAWANKIRVGN